MAGQAGIKDKTQIGDGVIVGAQAGVHRNVPSGQHVLGSPAVPVREQRRIFQMIARLPEMHRQLREFSGQIEALRAVLPQNGEGYSSPEAMHDVKTKGVADSASDPIDH
jgi:UDP-3-O-[3-hydroxymyristoyl] glucosamine N-acyltransferase